MTWHHHHRRDAAEWKFPKSEIHTRKDPIYRFQFHVLCPFLSPSTALSHTHLPSLPGIKRKSPINLTGWVVEYLPSRSDMAIASLKIKPALRVDFQLQNAIFFLSFSPRFDIEIWIKSSSSYVTKLRPSSLDFLVAWFRTEANSILNHHEQRSLLLCPRDRPRAKQRKINLAPANTKSLKCAGYGEREQGSEGVLCKCLRWLRLKISP